MPMSPQERQNLSDHLGQIYDWASDVDAWGADTQAWREGVDAYGEEAERRFVFLGSRVRDHQEQLNSHQRQLAALRQLTQAVPVWPLIVGLIAGVVTFFVTSGETTHDDWWCAGVGVAAAAIVFGVLWFIQASMNTRVTATRPVPSPASPANGVRRGAPAPQPAATPDQGEPTREMPPVVVHPPATQQPQPAAAPTQT